MTTLEFTVRVAVKAQLEDDFLRIEEMEGALGEDPDILEDKIKEAILSISDDYKNTDICVEIPDAPKVVSTTKENKEE